MTKKEKEQILKDIDALSTRFTTPTFGGTVIDTITLKNIIDSIPLQEDKPTKLYAILDVKNNKIIFNARGGCYKNKDDAEKKRIRLINGNPSSDDLSYKVVMYKLQSFVD